MLGFVMGLAGTGKTTHVLNEMVQRADKNKKSIFLVPDQFSSSAEQMVYNALQETQKAFVQVLSFRTLSERVLRHSGNAHVRLLSDAGRVVYVHRALSAVADNLPGFARQLRRTTFCEMCANTLLELKTAGATPADLREIARREKDDKLMEIALVYEAYEAEIENSVMDPDDLLNMASQKAQESFFEDTACFVDGFDGFTAPEYSMLGTVMTMCDELCVALCCDGMYKQKKEEISMFMPVYKAAFRLEQIAEDKAVEISSPLILCQNHRAKTKALAELCNIAGASEAEITMKENAPSQDAGVHFTVAENEWEEVRLVAAKMYQLARSGASYSDMALVCRDVSMYRQVVRRQFALYDIPHFMDASDTIEHTAAIAFIRAALSLLKGGLSSGGVLAMVKTGLCGISDESMMALENYVFTWSPKADEWRSGFDKDTEGLLSETTKTAKEQMDMAQAARMELMPKIEAFLKRVKGKPASSLSKELYLLLDAFSGAEHIKEQVQNLEKRGDTIRAENARRGYDLAMELLDEMASLMQNTQMSAEEYDELFLLLVRTTEFGHAPQTMESVIVTSADRMRLAGPEYCFVVGVCEGEFPMEVGYSGLLNHDDRDKLVQNGIEMPGSFENRNMLEEMFFYRAMCAPRTGMFISYPKRKKGTAQEYSANLEPVLKALQPKEVKMSAQDMAATTTAAYDLLAEEYRMNTSLAATLHKALEKTDDDKILRQLSLLQSVDNQGEFFVTDEDTIKSLVGEKISLSASRVEKYFSCRFAYFLERVLRVTPRRKAEVSPMESGSLVHYVLEKVLLEAGDDFAKYTDDQIKESVKKYSDEIIKNGLQDDTKRTAFKLAQITKTTTELVCFMRDVAAQSEFKTDALELGIGMDENSVPAMTITTKLGNKLSLIGKVDRVDVLKKDGKAYLCIIDYKTGSKDLDMKEIYSGINAQMMIYMDILCENAQDRYPDALPAGVLYLAADPSPTTAERGKEATRGFKLTGFLLKDSKVLDALDGVKDGSIYRLSWKKDEPTASKGIKLVEAKEFELIQQRVEELLQEMADGVYKGDFAAQPLVSNDNRDCKICSYRVVCRHEDGVNERQLSVPDFS